MPIRPENRARYPREWKVISLRIRNERAGNRCECSGECGQEHGRERHGEYIDQSPRCSARNGEEHPDTGSKVVLTVAHLDHTPENCADENLKAMCQRCHNRYDAPMRRAGMAERARAKMAAADLFEAAQ
jgi:hypothetical protein